MNEVKRAITDPRMQVKEQTACFRINKLLKNIEK